MKFVLHPCLPVRTMHFDNLDDSSKPLTDSIMCATCLSLIMKTFLSLLCRASWKETRIDISKLHGSVKYHIMTHRTYCAKVVSYLLFFEFKTFSRLNKEKVQGECLFLKKRSSLQITNIKSLLLTDNTIHRRENIFINHKNSFYALKQHPYVTQIVRDRWICLLWHLFLCINFS